MNTRDDLSRIDPILKAAADAASEFLAGLSSRPAALSPEPPAPATLPEDGLGSQRALALFRERFEAGLSGSPGPRYLGFVTGGSTPAALAGDWMTAAYDQNLADNDSIAAFVEGETLGLLRSLFGLPESYAGVFVSGATQANAVALATARQWAAERLGVDAAEAGLWQLPPIPVIGGTPHASISKALAILGMGRRCLEQVACLPGRRAVDPAALEQRLVALEGSPAIVIASAGEVNSGDFDDLAVLGELCKRYGAWLHVDGAFGLFAACDPHRANLLRGIETADSIATDGHKWLNVPYDSGIVFSRHPAFQSEVFKAVASYLGVGAGLLHRTPENSRRFRALPAWMTLMAYGRSGHRELVERCCNLAGRLGEGIAAMDELELLAPVRLNIVCFALRDGNADHRDHLLDRLLDDGRVYLTPTTFDERPGFRAAFVNWRTSEADVDMILAALADQVVSRAAGATP